MTLVRGDAIALPLADDSVDLIVTSPPYFALRSYTDGGEHYDRQIGSEESPQAFLEALWAVTAECKRVLKPSGSLWVNLGDKYAGTGGGNGQSGLLGESAKIAPGADTDNRRMSRNNTKQTSGFVRSKSLMGLPWRYAIGCVDQLDLILRAEVVWSKPNGLPESVTDRVRRSHEQWFHLTKEPRYFAAVDEIREPHTHAANGATFGGTKAVDAAELVDASGRRQGQNTYDTLNPLGKLPGSVWHVAADPLSTPAAFWSRDGERWRSSGDGCHWFSVRANEQRRVLWHQAADAFDAGSPFYVSQVDHFAAFPQEWTRRLILGWSPSGYCVACDQPRRPVAASMGLDMSRPQARRAAEIVAEHGLSDEHIAAVRALGTSDVGRAKATQNGTPSTETRRLHDEAKAVLGGYTREFLLQRPTSFALACACLDTTAPTRPSVVLDPFGGTGTVAMVARALGRYPVHIDLSADYLRLARWRIYESGHARKTTERTNRERQGALL